MRSVGRIRTGLIKRLAKKLLAAHPELFSDDFEKNKQAVATLIDFPSKQVRNQVAGYITRLKRLEQRTGAER